MLEKVTKVCFIVGNEDSGVNRRTLELCDFAVMVPMYGKMQALMLLSALVLFCLVFELKGGGCCGA